MAKKIKNPKDTKGVVVEIDDNHRANIMVIQSRYIRSGVRKTIAQIILDCFEIGIYNKLANTEKL